MNDYLNDFLTLLSAEKREDTVLYALKLLEEQKVDIITLYQDILTPSLNTIDCDQDDETCIWKEHVRTSIVRTIIECAYPYVIKEKKQQNVKTLHKKVLITCPSEEYHEIGAKMAQDFFLLAGYEVIYVGANTPLKDILSAVKVVDPDILAISVTNMYNLVAAKKIVAKVKEEKPEIEVYAGGQAFTNKGALETIGAKGRLMNFDDVKALSKGGMNHVTS